MSRTVNSFALKNNNLQLDRQQLLMINKNVQPIGIFDSGLGGLTVLDPLIDQLPNESTVYLGDLAHTPYGDKSTQEIIEYTRQGVDFLLSQNVKALVIACNSASSVALPEVYTRSTVPVFDVVSPGAARAIRHCRSHNIGVVGTPATISSNVYELELKTHDLSARVYQRACPKLAPMIEVGSAGADEYLAIIRECLSGLPLKEIDSLILGCTHYPIVKEVFSAVCGDEVRLIDSGQATAEHVAEQLKERGLLSDSAAVGHHNYFVTTASDNPATDRFRSLAERFLGRTITKIDTVNLNSKTETAQ